MAIYGTALLAICLIIGVIFGQLLGIAIGVDKNVGGVGIAMLLLIFASDHLQKTGRMRPPTSQGILFWSSIYIPIVVAMAASQNVVAAVEGGPLAAVAGIAIVIASFCLVPLIAKIGSGEHDSDLEKTSDEKAENV